MARVFVGVGSVAYGFHDAENGGFAERLKATMMQRVLASVKPAPNVINLSVPAQTLPTFVGNLPTLLDMYRDGRTVVVVMAGMSDSRIPAGQDKPVISLAAFESALNKFTGLCAEVDAFPIYVGMPPIEDAYTRPCVITGAEGQTFTNASLKAYNQVVQQHAIQTDAPYVDTWKHFTEQSPRMRLISDDHMHPNALANAILHDLILETIDQVLAATRRR